LQKNSSLWNYNVIWTYPAFFTNTFRHVYSKATQTIFNYIDAPIFKKFHTETVKQRYFWQQHFAN